MFISKGYTFEGVKITKGTKPFILLFYHLGSNTFEESSI